VSIAHVQNNFIKNLFITKSNERKSDTVSGHTSKPYNSSGKHLLLITFKVTVFIPGTRTGLGVWEALRLVRLRGSPSVFYGDGPL